MTAMYSIDLFSDDDKEEQQKKKNPKNQNDALKKTK